LLHIGCGEVRIEGWFNIDIKELASVDVVADVTKTIPFTGVRAIFAEHFLEHLRIDGAMRFLLNAHQALQPEGHIRLSTPNLDWTLATHYTRSADRDRQVADALMLNRAFRGWGHQFLWNQASLEAALTTTGFRDIRWCRYGESEHDLLRGLERHPTNPESFELPHVLIAEARKGVIDSQAIARAECAIWDELLKFYRDPEIEKPSFNFFSKT
jgi:predicted SAM-dependent methyltransferase